MFERPSITFDIDSCTVKRILKDQANPLLYIVNQIKDKRRVLDVGAGNGILSRLLKELQSTAIIDAIEPDHVACEIARPFYSSIFHGDIAAFLESSTTLIGSYDAIILADVIEHISNPIPVLKKLSNLLDSEGIILISTPNVAFGAVRLALLCGKFDYVSSGIIERTHLRFYTEKNLKSLVVESGYYLKTLGLCLRDPLSSEINVFFDMPFMPEVVTRLSLDRNAYVYQFVIKLEKNINNNELENIELGSRRPLLLLRYVAKWLLNFHKKIKNDPPG